MADTELTDLTAITVPLQTDLAYVVHDPAGTPVSRKVTLQNLTHSLGIFYVKDYGAVGDGSTDDTAAIQSAIDACDSAGGGVIQFDPLIYQISSSPTTVNGMSAQIHLPSRLFSLSAPIISIVFRGPYMPSCVPSVVGAFPTPTTGAVLRSTGTSGAVIGGRAGDAIDFTILQVGFENLTIRTQDNPGIIGLDLSFTAACRIQNVTVDTGVYDESSVTQPSHTNGIGVYLPGNANGAYTRIESLFVLGYYYGVVLGEHADIDALNTQACYYDAVVPTSTHSMHVRRWLSQHSRNGLLCTSSVPARLDVLEYNIERVPSGGSPTWQRRQNDVEDSGNKLNGTMRYAVVEAGNGAVADFTKSGGSSFTCTNMGN